MGAKLPSMLPSSDRETLSRELRSLFGDRVSQGEADRLIYSRDLWPRALLAVRDNLPSVSPPDFIVWPESADELSELAKLAARRQLPLTPYGGGSGVCGGAMARAGGVIVDLKRMCRVIEISTLDHLGRFQAGINGQVLEDELNLRGLTLGHFPSSICCSTLGGWLAARSAGQLSSRYGKIEDMVESLQVVLGDGTVIELGAADQHGLGSAIVGSEGTLGFITEATMRVNPLPEYRIFRAYQLPRLPAGHEAMRRVMQRGLRPAVMRLYDEMDTLLARPAPERETRGRIAEQLSGLTTELKRSLMRVALGRAGALSRVAEAVLPRVSAGCLLILGFEGEPAPVDAEAALAHAEVTAAGGADLGEEPGLHWYQNRYAVSYKMSPIYCSGSFVDTMEVATTWDRLADLYRTVRSALGRAAVVLAHFSHAYPEGCSIYFTFAAAAEDRARSEALYDEIWRQGLSAVLRAGGTISHHHGVGQSKAEFMSRELGGSMETHRQIKSVLDPANIMNPGKMGL